jgi:hypothetical protein
MKWLKLYFFRGGYYYFFFQGRVGILSSETNSFDWEKHVFYYFLVEMSPVNFLTSSFSSPPFLEPVSFDLGSPSGRCKEAWRIRFFFLFQLIFVLTKFNFLFRTERFVNLFFFFLNCEFRCSGLCRFNLDTPYGTHQSYKNKVS